MKLISDTSEKDLSILMVDFIWPAMIFSSIVTTLNSQDILSNLLLPLLSVGVHMTGFLVGIVICRFAGYTGDSKRMFIFHATMNNFLAMALPLTLFFLPEKGTALLAIANLGSIILLWTLGVAILAGNRGFAATARSIFSPAVLAIIAGVFCVFTGAGRFIPGFVMDSIIVISGPTLFFGLFLAGTQIYKLGRSALRFDGWNILVGLSRMIVIPGILFVCAFFLRGIISREALIIFLIISITPASVNSVTLALKYDSSAGLAAQGVMFTHVLAMGTMIGFVALIEKFFLV